MQREGRGLWPSLYPIYDANETQLYWPALLLAVAARADSGIDSWAALQAAVNRAESGAIITLSCDLTALESDAAINIPAGKRLTLDLNGHTLDRNRVGRDEGVGSAIHIEAGASLILRDSVGTGLVTGGNHDNGGGILNRGTLIMEGGCISGNTALHTGGGLANIGTMVLMGGSVRGNTALVQGGRRLQPGESAPDRGRRRRI